MFLFASFLLRQEVDNRFRGEGVIFITCGNKGIQEIGENHLWIIRISGEGHVKRRVLSITA